MKILIIMLFFISIVILLLNIKLNIKKIEILNRKIKFNIYLQIYLLNRLKLYEKKITKNDILKLIQLSQKRKVIKDEKRIIKNISIEIERVNIQILYNLKNPIHMAYIYGFLQSIINILIAIINPQSRNIVIKTQYRGKLYICISSKINISIAKTIMKLIKNSLSNKFKTDKKLLDCKR